MKTRRTIMLCFFIGSILSTLKAMAYTNNTAALNLKEVSMSLNDDSQGAATQAAFNNKTSKIISIVPFTGIIPTTKITFKDININLFTIEHTSKTRNSAYYFILLTRTKDMLNKATLTALKADRSHYELFNPPHKERY